MITVRNSGAKADFRAQIETLSSANEPIVPENYRTYYGAWDTCTDDTVTIMHGESRSVRLATFETSTSIGACWVRLYRVEGGTVDHRDTSAYVPLSSGMVIPEVCLRVTICASPSPKHGPAMITVKIDGKGTIKEVHANDCSQQSGSETSSS